MTDGPKREHALELMAHPLNRVFFENVVRVLTPKGVYGWPDMEMVFSRDEIEKVLEEARKKEKGEGRWMNEKCQ